MEGRAEIGRPLKVGIAIHIYTHSLSLFPPPLRRSRQRPVMGRFGGNLPRKNVDNFYLLKSFPRFFENVLLKPLQETQLS